MLFTIIIFFIIGAWAIEVFMEVLNIGYLGKPIPKPFVGFVDEEKYKSSQQYVKTDALFSLCSTSFNMFFIVLCLIFGFFNSLNEWLFMLAGDTIWQQVFFIAVLMLVMFILSLPFSVYKTFVIEEKFGFNKTTPKVFVLDLIKGLFLTVILGLPLSASVIWFFQTFPDIGWVIACCVAICFIFIIQYIAPIWIMPLFNKFTPLEDGGLRTAIEDLAEKNDLSLSGVFVIDGSKRSSKANAFCAGFGKQKRIALFDTLIESMSTEEIIAVLAHEIGHDKLGHVHKNMLVSIPIMILCFYLLSLFLSYQPVAETFGIQNMTVAVGMLLFSFVYTPVSILTSLFESLLSRKHEYEADAFAKKMTGNSQPLADALIKLSVKNLSNLTPHPAYVFMYYSHPPVADRIKALQK